MLTINNFALILIIYKGYVSLNEIDDISGGQENIPIPATNLVDDPPVPPSGMFKFINLNKLNPGIH
jgi:hypothetical protein